MMDNFDSREEVRGRGSSVSPLLAMSTTSDSEFSFPFEANLADLMHGYRTSENRVFTTSPRPTRSVGSLDSIEEIVKELKQLKIKKLQKCPPEERDFIKSLTPLHVAAALGDGLAIRRLVNEGDYDVDAISAGQRTPLIMACSSNQIEAIRLLVRLGANVNACSEKGMTPLILASINDDKDAISLLVKRGAKVNVQTFMGQTAIHFAASHGSAIAVKELLHQGIDPEISTKDGCSPLHLAVLNGQTNTIEELVESGCDLDRKSVV